MSIKERYGASDRTAADGSGELDSPSPALSFDDVYEDHHRAVTAVARRVCGADHAYDVAQDVFVAYWSDPERFDPIRGSLRSYLLVLAHHKAVDVLRRETTRLAREHRVEAKSMPRPAKVEDRLLRNEASTRVRAAVNGLPVNERDAIVSAFYEHRSYRATAKWMEVPEGTIKSRIRSGLQRLQPLLCDVGSDAVSAADVLADEAVCVEAPARWYAPPSAAELALLRLAVGPVLDIGCGPGRHTLALGRAGVEAVGIDDSAHFVAVARERGASVIEGSIFGAVPKTGDWGTCLLLDGNIGLGACPEALLRRAQGLVRMGGRVLVEAAAPGAPPRRRNMRVHVNEAVGASFGWVDVGVDRLRDLAEPAGLELRRTWSAEGRWFAWLAA